MNRTIFFGFWNMPWLYFLLNFVIMISVLWNDFSQYYNYKIMDSTKPAKATSYKDLIQNFQEAVTNPLTLRQKKSTPRILHLKKPNTQNKQNIQSKNHLKSTYERTSLHSYSDWVDEDIIKQLNHKRKEKQYHFSYNKFISYITNLMASLTGYVPPELLHKKMTYLQYLAALKEIKFIKETYEPHPADSIAELWNQLSVSQQTVGVFILFVSGILNIKKNQEQNTQRYQHLWKKYSDLRYTRMVLLGKTKTMENQQEYSFSPIISQRSRTLAGSRSKSKHLRQKCTNKKSHSQLLQESQQNKPSNNRSSMKQLECDTTGNKRSQILYKLAKEKSLQKKRDKKSNEVQYQKSIKELTFKPKIHPNNKQLPQKKYIQGQQDSIDRMIRGRVEREVKKFIIGKGLPYNEKLFQKMKKERYEALKKQKITSVYEDYQEFQEKKQKQNVSNQEAHVIQNKPTEPKGKFPLVLSVEVDQGVIKKLIIGEGQNYKQVAQKFIKQLNLSQQMYEKLIIGVQNALRSQLTQIDQDSFQSQYESIC